MHKALALLAVAVLVLSPLTAFAQGGTPTLEAVAKAMGNVTTLQWSGTGVNYAVGQSATAGQPWPLFNVKSFERSINYETGSLRDELVRSRVDAQPRGGGIPAMGEARQNVWLSGDHAWVMTADAAVPQPRFVTEMQAQLWTSPHGVVKAAMANKATVPGRLRVKAMVDAQNLIERVEAVFTNQVMGDMPFEGVYSDYRDFGGVKFPMRIAQSAGGFPALNLIVTEVKINPAVDIHEPDAVRQATNPYGRVSSQKAADGVWYITGGSHHSVAIEMKDHVIVVESPLDEQRAAAVLAEVRKLVPGKPVRYVVNSHHHFDHAGGIRGAAAEGVTVITHESSRAFFERALATPATVSPDRLARSGRKATVEGVRDKRVLTDGARSVEIHHIAGNIHEDGMLMVYLPKEKLLVEADAYTPGPANAPPPATVSPYSVNLADNIGRLNLAVDQILPLHGRIVPLAELNRAIGRGN
jgi:glyoxylase-like metal-dependent hydrolase (beta-lactamase superfamily II)